MRQLSEMKAISKVRDHVHGKYTDYPTDQLTAQRFDGGWSVFPAMDSVPSIERIRLGRKIFFISDEGQIMESSSSLPPASSIVAFHN